MLHAKGIRTALRKKFNKVTAQTDPDKAPVAFCITVPMDRGDIPALDRKLQETFNDILAIARKISGDSQHLHLFILGSMRADLDKMNLKTPLFYHIARPD